MPKSKKCTLKGDAFVRLDNIFILLVWVFLVVVNILHDISNLHRLLIFVGIQLLQSVMKVEEKRNFKNQFPLRFT